MFQIILYWIKVAFYKKKKIIYVQYEILFISFSTA